MKRLFLLQNFGFLLLTAVLYLAACNNDNTEKPNPAKEPATPGQAAGLTGGVLDTLKVDSAAFAALPNAKLVFSFVFEANNVLTLHGWSFKGAPGKDFDSLPNIKLLKKAASPTLPYGNGTYFGAVVLAPNDINLIQLKLRQEKAQWVVFAPRKEGNNIFYTIFVAKENPAILFAVKTAATTDIEANPSPPKNY